MKNTKLTSIMNDYVGKICNTGGKWETVNFVGMALRQVLMLYHLKTRHCVKYCTHVSKLKHCRYFN